MASQFRGSLQICAAPDRHHTHKWVTGSMSGREGSERLLLSLKRACICSRDQALTAHCSRHAAYARRTCSRHATRSGHAAPDSRGLALHSTHSALMAARTEKVHRCSPLRLWSAMFARPPRSRKCSHSIPLLVPLCCCCSLLLMLLPGVAVASLCWCCSPVVLMLLPIASQKTRDANAPPCAVRQKLL